MTSNQIKTRGHLRIFLSYYRPHWRIFVLDLCCALCISLVDLLFPYISQLSMKQLLPQQMFQAFFLVMGLMVAAYLLRLGMNYVVAYWGHLLGVRIEADIRSDLFRHMQELSFSF